MSFCHALYDSVKTESGSLVRWWGTATWNLWGPARSLHADNPSADRRGLRKGCLCGNLEGRRSRPVDRSRRSPGRRL